MAHHAWLHTHTHAHTHGSLAHHTRLLAHHTRLTHHRLAHHSRWGLHSRLAHHALWWHLLTRLWQGHLGRWNRCRLISPLHQSVRLDDRLALLVGQLADRLQVRVQVDNVIVEGFLDDAHGVFQRGHLAVELDQFVGERVLGAHMLVDIASVDGDGALAFTDNFLQLLVLLGQPLDVPIDHSQAIFEVVDLIVKHLVMGVHRDLGIDERVHTGCHIVEVLGVQLFELLHEDLG